MLDTKDQLNVVIMTTRHKIEGQLYLVQNSRLSDILNTENVSRDFLPVNNAVMTDLITNTAIKLNFVSVNKNAIELVYERHQNE